MEAIKEEMFQIETKEKLQIIFEAALDKHAKDVLILKLSDLSIITDYFLICTADSPPQVKAIIENIEKKLKEQNILPMSIEGNMYSKWVLMDYSDVIVHVFDKDTREHYSLEKMWLDAPIIVLNEKGSVT
ncbi:Iojap-like protein [Candidatus Magnetoovum chiemensis]|nr:Iojap-like protein [Candidatus Magnetoovum chiemensis]